MRTREVDEASLVDVADLTEIELVILKRLREVTMGEHRSRTHGTGFDFIGLREWQAGDRFASIDWAQSSLTGFSPLVVREFDQPSTATVVAVVDRSLSTRCGVGQVPIAAAMARTVATVGMSAVFFQDPFGVIVSDDNFVSLAAVRPRTGKGHVVHCLDAWRDGRGLEDIGRVDRLSTGLAGYLRRRALVAVVSDFLFEDYRPVLDELALLDATHDVFLVVVDSAFAFALPHVSAGWIETADVETGRGKTVSRRALAQMATRVGAWQDEVVAAARERDLDSVRVGPDRVQADLRLSEFVLERRLRKTQD